MLRSVRMALMREADLQVFALKVERSETFRLRSKQGKTEPGDAKLGEAHPEGLWQKIICDQMLGNAPIFAVARNSTPQLIT
jgi:hypothetical protein